MERARREVWEQRVRRWRESGLTAREFATEIGVNFHTLRQWKYKLEENESASSETVTSRPTFVEVDVPRRPATAGTASSEPFELELPNGLKVRVPMRFEPTALKTLIVALGVH